MSTDESVRTLATDAADDEGPAPVATGGGRRRGGRRRRGRDEPGQDAPVAVATVAAPSDEPVDAAADVPTDEPGVAGPRFWHRDHPVFTPLAGFFTGVVAVVVVLGLLGAILDLVLGYDVSAHPWVFLVALGVLLSIDLALVVAPGSRRFARYMLFGILTTPAVVLAAASFTTWLLLR